MSRVIIYAYGEPPPPPGHRYTGGVFFIPNSLRFTCQHFVFYSEHLLRDMGLSLHGSTTNL